VVSRVPLSGGEAASNGDREGGGRQRNAQRTRFPPGRLTASRSNVVEHRGYLNTPPVARARGDQGRRLRKARKLRRFLVGLERRSAPDQYSTIRGRALDCSIQSATRLSAGTARTSFFCSLTSAIFLVRLSARR
jgi:hypothetical protein